MTPFAQTFIINQPLGGADAVQITELDLYFLKKSAVYGVEVQIRTTVLGAPSNNMVSQASVILQSSQIYTSANGSIGTNFLFKTPVTLNTNTYYAIVVIPLGGNSDYTLWTATNGTTDAVTGGSVQINNQNGVLYAQSNDTNFTVIPNQFLKYRLWNAAIKSNIGTIVYRNSNTDFILIGDIVKSFVPGERIQVTNSYTTGASTTANTVYINVSNTTSFTNGAYVYVSANNRSNSQILQIANVYSSNTTLKLTTNVLFNDTNAIVGQIRGDGGLFGYFSSSTKNSCTSIITIDQVTSNASQNFSNASGQYLVGITSGASAKFLSLYNFFYDNITAQFSYVDDKNKTSNWQFQGTSNTRAIDSTATTLVPEVPYEFIDKQRMIMSRSNEFAANNSSGIGNSSLIISSSITASNNLFSPVVDNLKNVVTLVHNIIQPSDQLQGYYISLANVSGSFVVGDIVWQSNSTVNTSATITGSNNSFLIVSKVSSNNSSIGAFNANGTSYITSVISGGVANVSSVSVYGEQFDNGAETSRYISKTVILADNQDSEDLITFITAYRPPGTNFQVYSKFLSAADSDTFNNKDWSFMMETSSPALLSSAVNKQDYVELSYNLPSSIQVAPSGISASSASTTGVINFAGQDTSKIKPGMYVYVNDQAASNFNVRQVYSSNSSAIVLTNNTSFNSSNVGIGYIPNIISPYAAFKYMDNGGIMRYTTTQGAFYDSFKQFAVKIVLTSDSSIVVPKMHDMRSIALQV